MTDPAFAAQPEQQGYYAPPPPRRSSSTALMVVTGAAAAAFAAGALVLGSQSTCHEVPRPPADTSMCDGLYYESSRESCRDRLRVSDAHYPPPSVCTSSPLVLPLGVGAGVAGLAFLGLAGSAAFRRRDTITTSAANAYRSYQASAPQRAEAAQRRRENVARVTGTTAATVANAAEAFRERRESAASNRDVPPVVDYPDTFAADASAAPSEFAGVHTDPVPPTPPTTPAAAPSDDEWGF